MADEIQSDAPAETPALETVSSAPVETSAPEAPKTSFEAMTQRMEQMRAADAAKAAPDAKPDEAKQDAKADGAEDDVVDGTPEEKKAFQGKPLEEKFAQTRGKLKEARAAVKEYESKLAEFEPLKQKAELFEQLSSWTQQSGLEQTDVQNALQWAALMKNDPIKALEALTPVYENLRKAAGAVLPDDLAEQVNTGAITETAAEELSRLRRERDLLTSRNAKQTEQFQAQEQARAIADLQQSVRAAVGAAEQAAQSKDPDFSRKKGLIATEVQALMMQEGVPTTADGAVAQYKKALKNVNDKVALLIPRPQPVATLATTGASGVPAPSSSADAMRLAAEKMGMRIAG
jgi:hypothetical protein